MLFNNSVQTLIIRNLAESIEKKTGSDVKIGKVDVSFFNNLKLEEVYISDNHKDTLFYIKELTADISGINFSSNNYRLKNLKLKHPYLKIKFYEDEKTMSLFTFLNALENPEPSDSTLNTSFFFSSTNADIQNGRFVYTETSKEEISYGMNYDDMDFYNINSKISDLRNVGSAIKMTIDSLTCKEKSGFEVLETSTKLIIDNGLLRLEDTYIKLPISFLNAEYLDFSYIPGTKAWAHFNSKMQLDYLVKKSRINLKEISIFNDNLKEYNHTFTASGHITGTVQNMRGENLYAEAYDNTIFKGEVSMNGLPDLYDTFFDARIHYLQTSIEDLEKVEIPEYEERYLSFPTQFKDIGLLTAKGKFTGFLSDFVYYGRLFSNYGDLKTDVSVKPSSQTDQLKINGKVITTDFNAGELFNNNMLGNLSLNVDIISSIASNNYQSNAIIKGTVDEIEIEKYTYKNISVDGYFADKVFDGKLSMDDENVAFDFQGSFDLHGEVPQTNFTLDVGHAKLKPLNLNILTKDSLVNSSFKVISELSGGSIDETVGEIRIYDLNYINQKGEIATDSVIITSAIDNNLHAITLSSEYIDATLNGNFNVSELPNLTTRIFSEYINLPIFNYNDSVLKNKHGDLYVDAKKLNPILNLYSDSLKISDNSILNGYYNVGAINEIEFEFAADYVQYSGIILHNISLESKGDSKLKTKLNIDRIETNTKYSLLLLNVENTLSYNSMTTKVEWGQNEQLPYNGSISLKSEFKEIENRKTSITNTIYPSSFTINNNKWDINNTKIEVDSTDVFIDNFKIKSKNQSLAVNGVWSFLDNDSLKINVQNLDIKPILNTIGYDKINIDAIVNGYAIYKDVNTNFIIESDINIPEFIVDNHNFGRLSLQSDWNESKDELYNEITLSSKGQDLLEAKGYYGIKSKKINHNISLNNFNLKSIKGFTSDIFKELEGKLNGQLIALGTVENPIIDGQILVEIPRLTIDETGASYHLNESISLKNSHVLLEDFNIYDAENNKASLDGEILIGIGDNSNIDVNLIAQNFKVLQESYKSPMYGDARINADLDISGSFSHISIKGNVETDNNSNIIVPYGSSNEVSDNDFITFIDPNANFENSDDVLFLPTGYKSPVTFNLDFHIDPTTEIQVILESSNGSTLKTQGRANLYVSRDKSGNQNIMGEYEVSKGSFYYSLEGLINKKFILQEGGTVRWNGPPEKAYVDLDAVYNLKTSVQPLLYHQDNDAKQRQTQVICKTHITGQLEDPKLTFEIEFPNLDNTTRGSVQAALQTTDITKQVLSLLVFNRFTIPEYNPNTASNNNSALTTTTSDLLSSQVSNLLSQFSDDVNIGFIYRPGDDMTQEELGLAISTEVLEDRVIISGNFGFSSQDETNRFNDFIGDIDFDVKLNRKGNLRLRAFSHAKDNLYYYENKRNEQGIGIVYSEEFDTFKQLIRKYKEKFGLSKKNKKK